MHSQQRTWKHRQWHVSLLKKSFVVRVPDTIHTGQGRNFECTLIKELCQLIKKTRTTSQSDGMVERFHRTLLNGLSVAVA